jgi:hypothetical protein
MNGVDHVEPHTSIPSLVERLSAIRPARDPLDAARLRRRRQDARRDDGRPRNGHRRASQRHRLRQPAPGRALGARLPEAAERHVQTLLESYAEPLSVMARRRRLVRLRYPAGELRHAWKTLLQNHPHDSICGCSIDAVHEENMTRFARARQVGDARRRLALDAIADSCRRRSPGIIRAVVVNTDASSARRSSTRSSICRSTAPSRGGSSTRRRSIGRSPSGRGIDGHRRHRTRMAQASSFRSSARNASSRTS